MLDRTDGKKKWLSDQTTRAGSMRMVFITSFGGQERSVYYIEPIRVKGFDNKGTCASIKTPSDSVYVTMHVERYMHTCLVIKSKNQALLRRFIHRSLEETEHKCIYRCIKLLIYAL